MESGDGLVARVRPRAGALTLAQAAALADAAERLGNGQLELTRRANLQVRGLRREALPELHVLLAALGLLDPDVETEAIRNVMVAPLAGLDPSVVDVRPLAGELAAVLSTDRRLASLPAKFGWLVDGGGNASIAAEPADIALCAMNGNFALRLDRHWIGTGTAAEVLSAALSAATIFLALTCKGRMRTLSEAQRKSLHAAIKPRLLPVDKVGASRDRPLGLLTDAVGIAVPFGQLDAGQLRRLISLAADAGASEFRISPWRIVYFDAEGGIPLLEAASDLGLIVDPCDPLLRIDACPGAPSCSSASVDSRTAARWLAKNGIQGSVHVSGCAKGCARSEPADLVLIGEAGQYGVVRNGTTMDIPRHTVSSNDLQTVLHG